jgi:hypothetical protein
MKAVGSKDVEVPGNRTPVFEMVVLGAGGGPLETDCSGQVLCLNLLKVTHQQIPPQAI